MPITHSTVKEKYVKGLTPSNMEKQTATEFNLSPQTGKLNCNL